MPSHLCIIRAIVPDASKREAFDRDWPDVKRSREILVLAEEYGGS